VTVSSSTNTFFRTGVIDPRGRTSTNATIRPEHQALSALSPAQAGQGSGIVNACTFLGGSGGVAGGATAFALGGFLAVLTMIALAGIVGAALSRGISEKA
jgi:hypothetical protein